MTEDANGKAYLSNRDLILEMREDIKLLVTNQDSFVTKRQIAAWFAALGTALIVVSSVVSVILTITVGS